MKLKTKRSNNWKRNIFTLEKQTAIDKFKTKQNKAMHIWFDWFNLRFLCYLGLIPFRSSSRCRGTSGRRAYYPHPSLAILYSTCCLSFLVCIVLMISCCLSFYVCIVLMISCCLSNFLLTSSFCWMTLCCLTMTSTKSVILGSFATTVRDEEKESWVSPIV